MAKRNLIVELAYNKDLAEIAFSAAPAADKSLDTGTVPKIPGVKFDATFAPTSLPRLTPRDATTPDFVSGLKFDLNFDPNKSTYIVRAEAEEGKIADIANNPNVVGVFADVEIQPMLICPGDPPMGSDADVERLLCVPQMHRIGMNGAGILVAIVDTGFNLAYLAAHGKTLTMDAARSWVPNAGMIPGAAPVSHGTMCAFDAAIAAPRATYLDVQLLRSAAVGPSPMSGVLSDAVRAYNHLLNVMIAPRRPGETRSLVVNNSWGMFHPSWDLPVGNPGNYSDNPNHPFNRAVAALEHAGADILFAAGNCGANCPDNRCQGVTANAIYGANGHPSVLTVAGVDVSKTRVGYSTQGPGRLAVNKPDVSGYTHFKGSGVYTADGGTSAATPVVAGVVAAVRNKRPFNPGNPSVTPHAIRNLIRGTAEDLGTAGFDFNHGFGVVGGCALYNKHRPLVPVDICRRIPDLCRARPVPIDICRRFPEICRGIPVPPIPGPVPPRPLEAADEAGGFADGDLEELLAMTYQAGYHDGKTSPGVKSSKSSADEGCGCGGKR